MNANHITKKIEMTKTEAKTAGKPNNDAYNTLLELMKDFPGYEIEIVKSASKKTDRFKGLDYNYMMSYIESHNEALLKEFYTLRGLDENGKKVGMAAAASYGEIKMWFLEQFPEVEKMAENVNEIIAKARNAREARKNAENNQNLPANPNCPLRFFSRFFLLHERLQCHQQRHVRYSYICFLEIPIQSAYRVMLNAVLRPSS